MATVRMPGSEFDLAGGVLIVDDNRDLGDLYTAALRMANIEVRVAHNGAAGWTAATTLNPAVILLDIDLGHDNGFDLLHRLNQHVWPVRSPRIAMFTNSGDLATRSQAMAAGADAYLVKANLRLPQFIFAVKGLLDAPTSAEASGRPVASLAQR